MKHVTNRLALGCMAAAVVCLGQQAPENDIVFKAMKDEMARGRQLRVVGDPPYFIEYALDDSDLFTVSATYGALVTESHNRLRHPRVRIRVGDPKLDNSNHIFSEMYRGTRYDPGQFSLDDNYDSLRLELWLATDRVYKQALEAFARKKASLRNINVAEELPDMGVAPVVNLFAPVVRKPLDAASYRARVKEVSGLFSAYPQILNSEATASITQGVSYLVNSEGSSYRVQDNLAVFRVRATGLAPDGTQLRDYVQYLALEPEGFPATDTVKSAAVRIAENIDQLAKAPTIDNYSGPMLFEGVAGPQLLAQLLGRNLNIFRRPVSDPERPINLPAGDLEGRIGSRIMPEWMDAVDDPTQKSWRGTPLLGYYPIDSEGVVPKPLPVVEKGVLKTFYSTRQPIRGVPASNGHARLPGALGNYSALAGNLFISSSQPTSNADMKKRFLEIVKQRNLPYGVLVRKLDFPSTAGLDELRRFAGQQQAKPVSRPLLIYKVFPDGREEMIRGVRFRGLSARAMKDIQAASDEVYVFHYLENQAPFAHMDAGGYVAATSVVAPALLIDDLELEKIPGEQPKPPLVPPPPLTK
ncbi:MAG: hypothetical protein HY820_25925 [Acidobacteria bacterium]|nr:hypothetical protein [Acidobacteriota bacterium]